MGLDAECQGCGGVLSEDGRCATCGADLNALTATNLTTFIDKVKKMVVMPGAAKAKPALGAAGLVDARTGQVHPLQMPVFKVGRDSSNDLPLAFDTSVSRNHALITYVKDSYWIEDLGSTNGTYLNGRKIHSRKQISPGDRIVLGKTEFVLDELEGASQGFADYDIECEVGRGGMGIVYQAVDPRNKRTVAIKLLQLNNLEVARQKARSERFKREATLAQRLHHPNIITVYDVHLGPDKFYYVMEFLDGRSLRTEAASKGGRLTPAEFLPVLEQVSSALGHAHAQNVVHRDVKPDNIFILPNGTVKLTDFGIARVAADLEEANLTRSGAMLGTLAYSSPEQLNNARKVDSRADIFSLGVVTYEALSGDNPFHADGITETVMQVASRQEMPLHQIVPGIGGNLSAVVSRAMAKRASDRFRSVGEFVEQFKRALDSSASLF